MAFSPVVQPPSCFPNTPCCLIFVLQFEPAKPLLKSWYWEAARAAHAVRQAPAMTHPWPRLVNIAFIFLLAPREIIPVSVGGSLLCSRWIQRRCPFTSGAELHRCSGEQFALGDPIIIAFCKDLALNTVKKSFMSKIHIFFWNMNLYDVSRKLFWINFYFYQNTIKAKSV